MQNPEIELTPSLGFCILLAGLHLLVCAVLIWMGSLGWLLLPVVWVAMAINVVKFGLLKSPRSVKRIRLGPQGWYLELNNRVQLGPWPLTSTSRLDSRFIRLSFRASAFKRRHVILTPTMVGPDSFRRLQVFLRWAEQVNASDENGLGARQSNV